MVITNDFMIKYELSDIKLKTPGVQIRDKILEKYGSIKDFAEAIDLYESSIHQYLSSKTLGSSTFKIRTTRAFELDFNDLFETDEEQVNRFVSTVSEYIDEYNQLEDIKILDSLKKLVLEREYFEAYAVVCRCYAYYYYNQGMMDRAFAYIDVAVNTMRGRENVDRFGLYYSDMILMKSNHFTSSEFRKIKKEFNEIIERVTGPLTTGHMFRNVAKAYYRVGDLKSSWKFYKKVLDYHHDDKSISFIYMCLGDIKRDLKEIEEAWKYYQASEKLIDSDDLDIFHVYDEYAKYHIYKGDYESAELYINKIFDKKSWQIASSDHDFIETFNHIKFKQCQLEDIRRVLLRLLEDLNSGFIYASHQIRKFGETMINVECSKGFTRQLIKDVINYFNKETLTAENQKVLKVLLGDLILKEDVSI